MIKKLLTVDTWRLALIQINFEALLTSFEKNHWSEIKVLNVTKNISGGYYADPMFLPDCGQSWGKKIIVEKYSYSRGEATLAILSLDRFNETLVTGLKKGHHSFPYSFNSNEKTYCIPEHNIEGELPVSYTLAMPATASAQATQTNDILLPSGLFPLVDPVIHKKNGIFYLFASTGVNATKQELNIWVSADLRDWRNIGVSVSSSAQRMAGPLIEFGSRLFRVAQNHDKWYGNKVTLFEIDQLNEDCYSEHLVGTLSSPVKEFSDCFHTISNVGGNQFIIDIGGRVYPWQVCGGWIEFKNVWISRCKKIARKLKNE